MYDRIYPFGHFTCFGCLQHGLHREVAGLDVASLLQADDVAAVADNRPLPHHVQDSRLTHGNVALMNAEEVCKLCRPTGYASVE